MRKIAFILFAAVLAVALVPSPAAAALRGASAASAAEPAGAATAALDPLDRLLDWLSGWWQVAAAGDSSGDSGASGSTETPPPGENGPVMDPNGAVADTGN